MTDERVEYDDIRDWLRDPDTREQLAEVSGRLTMRDMLAAILLLLWDIQALTEWDDDDDDD